MTCPKCKSEMFIDDWNGWRWTCIHCWHVGRVATYGETEKEEIIKDNQLNFT